MRTLLKRNSIVVKMSQIKREPRKLKLFENSDDFGEFRTVFFVLQIFGLAPYTIGDDFKTSKRSKYLVVYNIFIAFLVMVNLYHAKKDPKNDLDFPNKTFLISVAYDVVDFLGNLYIFVVTINAAINTNIQMIVWFKLKSINGKFRSDLGVIFDMRKMKYYVLAKMFLLIFVSALFLSSVVLISLSMKLYYTGSHWLASLFPLLYSVVVGIIFGSCTLCLFQRLWVINEFLRKFIKEYPENKNLKTKTDLRYYSEKVLEELIFERRELYRTVGQVKVEPKQPNHEKKKQIPLVVMLKNYEECFGKNQQDVLKCVKLLKEIHFQLFELTNDLNVLFGKHFVFIFVTYFFGCTINLYFAITFHLRSFQSEQYVSACLWAIVYLFLIMYLITYSNIASNEVSIHSKDSWVC